jgi:pilus assembly protein CpaB
MTEITGTRAGGSRWALRAALFLALALVAAGGAAFLLTRWVNARTAAVRVPTAKVVAAAAELPVGTRLAREHLAVVDWPASSRPGSVVADPAGVEGQIVAARIFKGEPILPEKLVSGKNGSGLAALLPEGARAMSVRVDDVVGVAGFIHPGDFVDVVVTMHADDSGGPSTAKIILQGIKVLAVGKQVDAQARDRDEGPATVATLQVNGSQAERLALAAAEGKLLLALRGAADSGIVETRGVGPRALLGGPEPRAEPAPPPRVIVMRPREAPKPEKEMVEILRGDLYERRGFEKRKEGSP